MSHFILHKHYFDCIDDHGHALIAYAAELSLPGVRLPYAAAMQHGGDGILHEQGYLKRARLETDAALAHTQLTHSQLALDGTWQAQAAACPPQDLLALAQAGGNGKQVIWHAHTPKARVNGNYRGQPFAGWGYAETLTLTLPPWRLPLDELYWGRFISEHHSVVWLEWRGSHPLRLLFADGVCHRDFVLSPQQLRLPDSSLCLDFTAPTVLKDEPLLALVQRFPALGRLFGRDFLHTRESKWKSPALLTLPGMTPESGWAVYETVYWRHDAEAV